jgi:ParB family transcriptional regulator, chromosome partitioning protein
MVKKGGLGKGLSALIPGDSPASDSSYVSVPVNNIIPNPRQPRAQFDDASLKELADSIREHGIIQPLIVTIDPGTFGYILVAGERRLRAARLAGLEMVPVIIRQVSDQERLELALIENIQRADLTPLETAEAYRQLQEEFGLRHEDIGARVGKSRVTVTNTLRLLQLPNEIKQALIDGKISEGHARALRGLPKIVTQLLVLKAIIEQNLTVRQTEELVKTYAVKRTKKDLAAELRDVEERLRGYLGTKVALHQGKKGGSLIIYYYSDEELDSLINHITKDS